MAFNVDFSASAQFKGHNQKPLWIADGRGLFRPSLQSIAKTAVARDLDMVVLRSYSHPNGTDNRWDSYYYDVSDTFYYLGRGVISYLPPSRKDRPLFLVHGQGLKTTEGDVQVLFSENLVGGRNPNFVSDFKFIVRDARAQGQQVIITASKPYNWNRDALKEVDAIEIWNGVDYEANSDKSLIVALEEKKPGIIVSNSKTLFDLGRSYSTLPFNNNFSIKASGEKIGLVIKEKLKESQLNGRTSISWLSRAVQAAAVLEVKYTGNVD